MSLMIIWSAVVPSNAATFVLIPSTFSGLADLSLFKSAVSMATIAAALVSATSRTPSGPNAIGPADFNVTAPSFMLLADAASAAGKRHPANTKLVIIVVIFMTPRGLGTQTGGYRHW